MNLLNKFSNKRKVYTATFECEAGEAVLADLATFCGQYGPTYRPGDPYETAYREGMRRVYLRISNYLNKDEKEMMSILKKHRSSNANG